MTEEEHKERCYICYERDSALDKFVDPHPCYCKGSIKIHTSCLRIYRSTSDTCQACKKKFRDLTYEIVEDDYMKIYWCNGKMKEEGPFIDGIKSGHWKFYDYNGKIYSEGPYPNGIRNGQWKHYYTISGYLKSEGNYINDLREGHWKKYNHLTGNLSYEGPYLNGSKHGNWKWYYPDNPDQLESEIYMINGNSLGPSKEYYPNGVLKKEGHYLNCIREGIWKFYNPDSTLRIECEYVQGTPTPAFVAGSDFE